MKSAAQTVFIVLFFIMTGMPLIATELQRGRIAEAENRIAAPVPDILEKDGTLNEHYNKDFETWINDNIGYRSSMIKNHARLQYYLFGNLGRNSDMYLGPRGELNYATEEMLKDYQHANLYPEEYLQETAKNMQRLSDYAQERGAQFYYYQCWDKHSIYPEYFPETVVQTGDESKTDGIVRALKEHSAVHVISPKQELLDEKPDHASYSVWGDPTHWTERGAYTGYLQLMRAINENAEKPFRILQERDYIITEPDQGKTLFGCIHRTEHLESFRIKEPKAVPASRLYASYAKEWKQRVLINDSVDNDTCLLVIGDSYFNTFIIDDLAESFHETIFIRGEYLADFRKIVDTCGADIIVLETAERVDITKAVAEAASQ